MFFLTSLDVDLVLNIASIGEGGLSEALEKQDDREDWEDKSDETRAVMGECRDVNQAVEDAFFYSAYQTQRETHFANLSCSPA